MLGNPVRSRELDLMTLILEIFYDSSHFKEIKYVFQGDKYYVLGDHVFGAGREAVSFTGKEYNFLSQNNHRILTEELFS